MEAELIIQSKIVGPAVGVEEFDFAFFSALGFAVFHSHDHVFGFAGDVFEDVLVVHFPGEGFLAAGVVALLEVGDL